MLYDHHRPCKHSTPLVRMLHPATRGIHTMKVPVDHGMPVRRSFWIRVACCQYTHTVKKQVKRGTSAFNLHFHVLYSTYYFDIRYSLFIIQFLSRGITQNVGRNDFT